MKFWRQKQSGVMRIPSFEWVNILEYMNLVQYEKNYFSFFFALEPGPMILFTSLKERLRRSACLFKSVLSLVACNSFLVIPGGNAILTASGSRFCYEQYMTRPPGLCRLPVAVPARTPVPLLDTYFFPGRVLGPGL